jgi:hypothetical protein
MPVCIYCLEEKGADAFSREHVVQEGFGRFRGALTLHDTVCGDCNQLFGETIDRELQREGAEGLERYRWGAKKPADVGGFRYTQVTLRAKDAGDFSEARFELEPARGSDGLVARLASTVAFAKKDGSGFVEFTEAQVAAGAWRSNPEIDWQKGIKAFAEGEALDRLLRLLAEQGVRPKNVRSLELPFAHGEEITVEQAFAITDNMYRAIAKIAFNYLAYREGAAFVLGAPFNALRRCIRYGEPPPLPPIHTSWDLPFRFDTSAGERPVVHFVCVSPRHPSHNNVLGVVSLFGFLTHTVMLAEGYEGTWPEPHAHLYNLKDRSVHPWKAGVPFKPTGRGKNRRRPRNADPQ